MKSLQIHLSDMAYTANHIKKYYSYSHLKKEIVVIHFDTSKHGIQKITKLYHLLDSTLFF